MKRHSQRCTACAWDDEIVVAPFVNPPCPSCGGVTERWWPIGRKAHGVIGDEFVGGLWVENLAPTPVYVESRSQYKRELAARGLEQKVRHVGQNHTDKSSLTTRWF